jgi:2-haloacid dehalogenase
MALLGAPEGALQLWFAQSLRDYFALSHSGGYVPLREVLRAELPRTLAQLGVEATEEVKLEVIGAFAQLDPRPDLADAVEHLAAAGWKLLALTNGSEDSALGLLERALVSHRFSGVLSCDSISVSKPNPQVYELALSRSEGEAWMVAAHGWDIAGAARAGMRTAFVSSVEGAYLDVFPEPDVVAASLLDAARAMTGDA